MDKVLELAAKTGDKVIVLSDHHDPYVIMTVKEYEALLHGPSSVKELTEDELLDKINRDIAVWKASRDDLDDYSLDQFKVETLRKKETAEGLVENLVVDPDQSGGNQSKEEHSRKADKKEEKPVVDNITVEEDDKYYIEPVD